MSTKYISLKELIKAAEEEKKLIPLATRTQIKNGKKKDGKASYGKWDQPPKNYTGISDSNFGTAIQCTYIEKLKRHLVIIDLDIEKEPGDVPLPKLKHACEPIFKQTYTVKTPSQGVHIYILSKEKPKQSQPKINIDYQTNTGKGKGKYVVLNWRWDEKGENKEYYTKLQESPDQIALVKSSDLILQNIYNTLIKNGHLKTTKTEYDKELYRLLKKYVQNGGRHNFSYPLAGFFRKQGYPIERVKEIISNVFSEDEELDQRLNDVETTFQKPLNEVLGIKWLKDHMSPEDINTLLQMTKTHNGDIRTKILHMLSKNQEPSSKIIADCLNTELELYKNLDTNKYYEKTEDGQFQEIDERRIIKFCNQEFGVNSISSKRCYEVLKFITNPIKKNYNLIEFTNGILNTETKEFTETKTDYEETPKLTLDLEYNPRAKPGRVKEILCEILDDPDLKRWLRMVGHAYMKYNKYGLITMVQGPPGTGKSTLTTILKRIFKYSELRTQVIAANQRFTLFPLIDRDINIDDDINNGMLTNIGFLNSVITGDGFTVEVKGETKNIEVKNPQTPRLFANGNSLPPVVGEGFNRRLLLIHANNKIKEIDYNLRNDIMDGKLDKDGIEWLVYTAIQTYWDNIDEPIVDEQLTNEMESDYLLKSYPVSVIIDEMFDDDWDGDNTIKVKEVNKVVKMRAKILYKEGKISKEHRNPGNSHIKKAMDRAGYDQKHENVYDKYGGRTMQRVYVDIKKTKYCQELSPEKENEDEKVISGSYQDGKVNEWDVNEAEEVEVVG